MWGVRLKLEIDLDQRGSCFAEKETLFLYSASYVLPSVTTEKLAALDILV